MKEASLEIGRMIVSLDSHVRAAAVAGIGKLRGNDCCCCCDVSPPVSRSGEKRENRERLNEFTLRYVLCIRRIRSLSFSFFSLLAGVSRVYY